MNIQPKSGSSFKQSTWSSYLKRTDSAHDRGLISPLLMGEVESLQRGKTKVSGLKFGAEEYGSMKLRYVKEGAKSSL